MNTRLNERPRMNEDLCSANHVCYTFTNIYVDPYVAPMLLT